MRQLAPALVALAFVIGAIYLLRAGLRRPKEPGTPTVEGVPAALRPGDPDDVLESARLSGIIRWGAVSVIAMALFLPIYWLQEAGERRSTEERMLRQSIDRGRFYFAMLEDPETGEHPPRGEGHPSGEPFECARCHGSNLEGGDVEYLDPETGERVQTVAPELRHVFARYEQPPPGFRTAREFIFATIERGRTRGVLGVGLAMPTWGVRFGGPLPDEWIDDIISFIESEQGEGPARPDEPVDGEQIFAQFCAPCHGPQGRGGSAPAIVGGTTVTRFPDLEDHAEFVTSGSRPGQPYGVGGMGTGAMPAWRGILTDEQIRAVVEYERNL